MIIKKNIGIVYIYNDETVVEDQSEGEEAIKLGLAYGIPNQDWIICPKADLKDCYNHHVNGDPRKNNPDEQYTVLRKPDGKPVFNRRFEFEAEYKEIIRTNDIKQKGPDYIISFNFKLKSFAAFIFQDGENITKNNPSPAKLFCRGLKVITEKDLLKPKPLGLEKDEARKILKEIGKTKIPKSEFKIRNIWIIGHSDIR